MAEQKKRFVTLLEDHNSELNNDTTITSPYQPSAQVWPDQRCFRFLETSSTCPSATTFFRNKHKLRGSTNTWISYLLLTHYIFPARSWVPRTLPTSLSWRSGTATPAFPRPSSRPALCRAEVCLSVYLYTEIWLLFVLFLHYICLVFVCTDLFDYLLRRSPPTSTKHPSRQADVCQAEQKPDRQGDTIPQFFSLLNQMAKFVLIIISQITCWLILLHPSSYHILTLIFAGGQGQVWEIQW